MTTYYHACKPSTLDKIYESGIVKKSFDGCVYLCKAPDEAARFIALRLLGTEENTIIVLQFDDLDEDKIEEVFDHNEAFWGCKCYGYFDDIPVWEIDEILEYTVGGQDG